MERNPRRNRTRAGMPSIRPIRLTAGRRQRGLSLRQRLHQVLGRERQNPRHGVNTWWQLQLQLRKR